MKTRRQSKLSSYVDRDEVLNEVFCGKEEFQKWIFEEKIITNSIIMDIMNPAVHVHAR